MLQTANSVYLTLPYCTVVQKLPVWFVVADCCQQAGAVTNQPIINAVNARMNAAVVQSPVQSTIGNMVVRPSQSTVVVGPTATNAAQPAISVVRGRMNVPLANAVNVPRSAVPASPSVASMYAAKRTLSCGN